MQGISRLVLCMVFFALPSHWLKGAGLLFSRDAPQTNLDLFGGKHIAFANSVTISFDLSILNNESFGQIWVYEDEVAPYSFAYIGRDKNSASFVINSLSDKKQFLEIPVSPQVIGIRKWLHIETKLDFQRKEAVVTIDGQQYRLCDIAIPNPSKANLIFGANNKAIPENPVMEVKNIRVKDEGTHAFVFLLAESDGNKVHEVDGKLYGSVVNPQWQINRQFYWQEIGAFSSSAAVGIAFDELHRQLLFIGNNQIGCFDVNTLKLTEYEKETIGSQIGYSGEAIYNPVREEIYFYNLADIGGLPRPFFSTISVQDVPTRMAFPRFTNPLHHHAYFFEQASRSIYIFGGYGNYQYSNRIYCYDFDRDEWAETHFTGDTIYPRMHTVAGRGPIPGSFLVFGGVGNETGKQELGKDFFCDLYLFDTHQRTIRKLWSREFPGNYFIPTRGLVLDKEKGCIYLLCIDRDTADAFLHRFDVNTGEHAVVSDKLNFQTNCILSTMYLFANPEDEELYAVMRYCEDNNPEAKITIYRLNAPPITYLELKKWNMNNDGESHRKCYLYGSFIGVFCLGCCYVVYRWKKRRNGKSAPISDEIQLSVDTRLAVEGSVDVSEDISADVPVNALVRKNSVYLFGDFLAFDAKGHEMSYRFAPKIKQMFVLLLFHSYDGQDGIGTRNLSACLWREKTTTAAKNIRNVTINHLRNILADFSGVELVFLNDKWKLVYGDDFYCDYFSALSVANTISRFPIPQETDIRQLVNLLRRGTLLPSFVHYEWFESIKISHDELFIRVIEQLLPVVDANNEYRRVILLTDILFSFDGMSATALTFKVNALRKLGQKASAQSVYERFQKEYQQLYGEKYEERSLENEGHN